MMRKRIAALETVADLYPSIDDIEHWDMEKENFCDAIFKAFYAGAKWQRKKTKSKNGKR